MWACVQVLQGGGGALAAEADHLAAAAMEGRNSAAIVLGRRSAGTDIVVEGGHTCMLAATAQDSPCVRPGSEDASMSEPQSHMCPLGSSTAPFVTWRCMFVIKSVQKLMVALAGLMGASLRQLLDAAAGGRSGGEASPPQVVALHVSAFRLVNDCIEDLLDPSTHGSTSAGERCHSRIVKRVSNLQRVAFAPAAQSGMYSVVMKFKCTFPYESSEL